ncbi:MAG: hypothetical protein ACO1RX_19770 [Candidatus Sericytochromatia bacterium]
MFPSRFAFSHSLWAVLALSLTACGPMPLQPSPSPSPTASALPVVQPSPSLMPSQPPSAPSGVPTGAPSLTPSPVNAPAGSRLLLSAERRFFNEVGEKTQLSVSLVLPDGTQRVLSASEVSYVSSRPQDMVVSGQGEVTSLVDDGYSEITASVLGSDLRASVRLSVSRFVGGSSGGGSSGGGGGGSTPTPTPTPTPSENLNVSLGFEGLVGGEFQVNQEALFDHLNPAIARAQDGNFVVAWERASLSGADIYAQRYNSQGEALGGEFRVNTYTSSGQSRPAVSLDADGDFVVAWESLAQDGNNYGVYAQRYNSQGMAQGSEFRVNTYTFNAQRNPAVSLDAEGDFVVTWQSTGQDGNGEGVYAQRYTSVGVVQGSEFRVNTYTLNNQLFPSVSLDADGDFVVAWESYGQDGDSDGIYAQRYSSGGQVQGSEFRVNTYTLSAQSVPSVSLDADGDFVVAWQSVEQDGDNEGIYAQRYSSGGQAQGSEFRVNTYTTASQRDPSVSLDADGDFVVAWDSYGQDGGAGIYVQRYTPGGQVQGTEFQVSNPAQYGSSPSVALTSLNDFAVVWVDSESFIDPNIYARLYKLQSQQAQ